MRKVLLLFAFALMTASVDAQSVRRGDANNDKQVDSQDVTEVSGAILGKQSANYNEKNADVNRDEKVNAADAVVIVNMIIDGITNSGNQRLVVLKKDGTKVFYDLAEKPTTTFSDGQLVVATSQTTDYYPLNEIVRYTYEGAYDEIGKAEARSGATLIDDKQ